MKNRICLLILFSSIFSFGQKKYFKDAIEKGRNPSNFYYCNLSDSKVVKESDVRDYAYQNNYIIKNVTTQQVNRFGDSFTGVNTFEFLPISEISNYVFSKYVSNDISNLLLSDVKKYNKGKAYIFNPTSFNFQYREVYWSGTILENQIQGEGFGLFTSDDEKNMIFFRGNFDKGSLKGNAKFNQYTYNSSNFENGNSIKNTISLGVFNENTAVLKIENKYGFINSDFNIITPIKYESIDKEYENGKAFVTLNNEKIIIDSKGNFLEYTQEQKNIFEAIRIKKEKEERKLAYYKPQIEAYERIAKDLSYKIMKEISPNTGKENQYNFLYNDFENGVREVKFSWRAKQYALADNYYTLEVTGKIHLEEGRFEQTSENSNTTAIRRSNNQLNLWSEMGSLAFEGVKTVLASLPEVEEPKNINSAYSLLLSENNKSYVYFREHSEQVSSAYINVIDGGDMLYSNSSNECIYLTQVYDKNGKLIKSYNNPYDDNGIGSPSINYDKLPGIVIVNYCNKYDNKPKKVELHINKGGNYDLHIK